MFKHVAAAIAAISLALLSACGSQSTSDSTSSSTVVPTGPVTLEHYDDGADLPAGTTVTMTAILEVFDDEASGVATLCLESGDSDPPACFEERFIALNVPVDNVVWWRENTEQFPQYRYTGVSLTGTLVYPGVIDVSEVKPLPGP